MLPEHDRGRPGERAASNVTTGDLHIVPPGLDGRADRDPFTWGVLADAFNTGRRLWWLKRARDFDNAKPLPGEYHGNATREQLSAQWRFCHEVAQACRNKAELIGMDDELETLLRDVA